MLTWERFTQHRFVVIVLATVLLGVSATSAQSPTPAPEPDVKTILQEVAQQVLTSCGSWPPSLAKPGDQAKLKKGDKKLQNGTDILTAQLAGALSVDAGAKPMKYDASFLRMLDSIGTFTPVIPDSQLLGIALKVDPSELNLWGTNLATLKYDCMSMLGLTAQASGGLSIPLFSLNAAFNASQSISTNETATFIVGTFQSPFDVLYHSQDQSERLFSALKALDWRLVNAGIAGQDQYVAAATILSLTKAVTATEATSILASIKAGLKLPFVTASGGTTGQLARSLQANSTDYVTYFWGFTPSHLPSIANLVSTVIANLPTYQSAPTELAGTAPSTINATVSGWPADLCTGGAWTLIANNSNFTASPVTMTSGAVSATGGIPACTITGKVWLTSTAAATPPTSSGIANPQLYLQNVQDNSVKIALQPSGAFSIAGKPSVSTDTVAAQWKVLMDPTTGKKASLQWVVPGHVDLPADRTISSLDVNVGDFSYKSQDNSTLDLSDVEFEGPGTSASHTKAGPDNTFRIDASLSLLGVATYDDNLDQLNKKQCSVSGVIQVATTDNAGASFRREPSSFQSSLVFYPNKLAAPSSPTGLVATPANSQVALVWTKVAGATSYNVYRGTASLGETQLATAVTTNSFPDTGLTNGTALFYEVTAVNSVGESGKSAEVSSTPHM